MRPWLAPFWRPTCRHGASRTGTTHEEHVCARDQKDTDEHAPRPVVTAPSELQNLHPGFESRTRLQVFEFDPPASRSAFGRLTCQVTAVSRTGGTTQCDNVAGCRGAG